MQSLDVFINIASAHVHEASNTCNHRLCSLQLLDETQQHTSTQCQTNVGNHCLTLRCICRIEELEKAHAQLNGERQRLQEDLEEVQERLTAGQSFPSSPHMFAIDHPAMQSCVLTFPRNNLHESSSPACCSTLSLCVINGSSFCNVCRFNCWPRYCFHHSPWLA